MNHKRRHAKHLEFLFPWLITRRSLVQIQPPQPAILNFHKGLLILISRPFLPNCTV
jgi:hypothetical protein